MPTNMFGIADSMKNFTLLLVFLVFVLFLVFVYLFANSAKERDHSCPVNANIYFGLVIGHYLSLGEGRESEDFGCVAIK